MSARKREEKAEEQYRVWVVELDDAAGERRRPDRPNLHVGVTIVRTDLHEHLMSLKHPSGRRQVERYGLCVRDDLTPECNWVTRAEVDRQRRRELTRTLRADGYTVNGDRRVWRVYAIELDAAVHPHRDPGLGWIYVGETAIDVERRYRQHVNGDRNGNGRLFARVVRDHHLRLRPDLYEDEPLQYSAEASKGARRAFAARLEECGYSIAGGH